MMRVVAGILGATLLCLVACEVVEGRQPTPALGSGPAGPDTGTSGDPGPGPGPVVTTFEETGSTTFGEAEGSDEGTSNGVGVETPEQCSTFAQNCPAGYKCAPFGNDGASTWNDTMCVPVVEDPVGVGQACTAGVSGFSGFDNCGVGELCLHVDPKTLQGECVELCGGSHEDPACEQFSATCNPVAGPVSVCLGSCDPLGDHCEEDELCIPGDDAFVCAWDAGGDMPGGQGDSCEFLNVCDPGLVCAGATTLNCNDPNAEACCTNYCNLEFPNCPDELTCVPWWEEGAAPEAFDHVGACVAQDG